MLKEEHRVYFSSKKSTLAGEHFIFDLPYTLDLSGKWKCALKDFYIHAENSTIPKFVYVLGDFCETSFVNGRELPVIAKIYIKKNINFYSAVRPLYIPLKQKELRKIELLFLDSNLQNFNFDPAFLIECTLHFYKYGG